MGPNLHVWKFYGYLLNEGRHGQTFIMRLYWENLEFGHEAKEKTRTQGFYMMSIIITVSK